MRPIKVVYICHFSTMEIRKHLKLKSFWLGNVLRRAGGLTALHFNDAGTWNVDFIKPFEENNEIDCFVISHHLGMVHREQRFETDGVHYVFLKEKENLIRKVVRHITGRKIDTGYGQFARNIREIVNDINPDIVVVCGAENPIYSSSVLEINNKPIFVILQTWLNSPKRKAMDVGDDKRRALENDVFEHAGYFATFEHDVAEYIWTRNPRAFVFRLMFPSSVPEVENLGEKKYDFIFYASGLTKNKGIEDTLIGLSFVKQQHSEVKLCVIGDADRDYMTRLQSLMNEIGISDNVILRGYYPSKSEVIKEVMQARIAVLPGITAPLNSTVRETMLMGMPTIVYSNEVIEAINCEKINLIPANMEDTEDLGHKMLYAFEHPEIMEQVAENAKRYAMNHFSSEAVGKSLISEVNSIVEHYYRNITIPENFRF